MGKFDPPLNVLYVNGGIMDMGGISSYMMNYYRHINKNKIHIDFVVHGNEQGIFDEEIKDSGSFIYNVPVKSKDYLGNINALKKIFNTKKYPIVHSHLDAGSYHVLKVAKSCGIPVRIAHSHNTDFLATNSIKQIINRYYRAQLKNVANYTMACSDMAGKWLFGENSTYQVIKNAIDIRKFVYSEKSRFQIRRKLNIDEDKIVIGHVGRFDKQKNHMFLLKLFAKLVRYKTDFCLVLIGDGNLRSLIENEIEKLHISDYVYLIGYTREIEKYYSAFDLFVMPSLFEGLGIAAIEAQTNGLPCILADTLPAEAVVSSVAVRIPLQEQIWLQTILKTQKVRQNNISSIIQAGYDIETEAQYLEDIYFNLVKR